MIDFFMVLWCRLMHVRHWRYTRIGEVNFGKCARCGHEWKEPY